MLTDVKKIGDILLRMAFVITRWCLCTAMEAVALLHRGLHPDLAVVFKLRAVFFGSWDIGGQAPGLQWLRIWPLKAAKAWPAL